MGDTQALFLPITTQAQDELWDKATPSKNLFYDRDGSPIYEFSLEFIYGLYYATNPNLGSEIDYTTYDKRHKCDYTFDSNGNKITTGSIEVFDIFDKYELVNYKLGDVLTKKVIKNIVHDLFIEYQDNIEPILELLYDLCNYSTDSFTESGLSIKYDDFIDLDKSELLKTTKVVDYVHEESKLLDQLDHISESNAFISMYKSGTKGNHTQLKQIMVGKGVLVNNDGDYLEPIKNSLIDGLSFNEFITTIYAGRRGLVSKSLSTADSGYHFYKVVKSLRDYTINNYDCETDEGIELPLSDCLGRIIVGTDDPLTKSDIDYYKSEGTTSLVVRSPITCKMTDGCCSKCYGNHTSRNKLVNVTDNVGIISSATTSEVISQAMLRNFHTAGSTNINSVKVLASSNDSVLEVVDFKNHKLLTIDGYQYIVENHKLAIIKDKELCKGDLVFTYDTSNDSVNVAFDKLSKILQASSIKDKAIISKIDGKLEFIDVIDEVVMVKDKGLGLELPKKLKLIKFKISNENESLIIEVPSTKQFLVPFNSNVTRGQVITDGLVSYTEASKILDKSTFINYLLNDLKNIYLSQGANVLSIHLEVLVSHLIDDNNGLYNITSIMDKGLDRSYIQYLSLGWYARAIPNVLDNLREVGKTNADKVVLGTYDTY